MRSTDEYYNSVKEQMGQDEGDFEETHQCPVCGAEGSIECVGYDCQKDEPICEEPYCFSCKVWMLPKDA